MQSHKAHRRRSGRSSANRLSACGIRLYWARRPRVQRAATKRARWGNGQDRDDRRRRCRPADRPLSGAGRLHRRGARRMAIRRRPDEQFLGESRRARGREGRLGRDLPRRARALLGPGDRRDRDARDPNAGDRHHHADDRRRYRRCRLLHLGGDALHDRLDRRRRIDRGGLGPFGGKARLCPGRRNLRARHRLLRPGARYRHPDRRALGSRLGRRVGRGKRHGADHQPLQRAAAYPHHRHIARHFHRLSFERTGSRRHVRGDALVARVVLGDGAVHAGLRRPRLCKDPRPARRRDRARPAAAAAPGGARGRGLLRRRSRPRPRLARCAHC